LLWTVVFLVGPGFFLPVEQEVSRALAERRSRGEGGGPLVRQAALLAAVVLGVLLVAVAATAPLTLPKLFDDEPLLLIGLALALAGAAASCSVRW
jgi:hypothetical protein